VTEAKKLLSLLFDENDIVNLRLIKNSGKGAVNELKKVSALTLAESYADSFPCVGINPREKNIKILAAIKNLVIDIDGAALPAWAKERADVICSRDEKHHHIYFCFASGATRDEYKDIATRLIAAAPGADKAVSDPERVIRLPGYAHEKRNVKSEGYRIIFVRDKIERVPIAEKFSWLTAPVQEAQQITQQITQQYTAPNALVYLRNLYAKKEKLGAGEGRSRRLWFVGVDCHDWGIPFEDALKLAHEVNAAFLQPEDAKIVEKQVRDAYKYAKNEFGALVSRNADKSKSEAQKELRAFERAQRVRDLFSDWIYVHAAGRFCNTKTGLALASKEQIEDYISMRIGEAVKLRDLLSRNALTCADKMAFDPMREEKIFESDGITYYNAYTPPQHPAARAPGYEEKAVSAFLEHVGYLTTSEDEEKHLLDYFAFCVQNRGQKVDWTPLIISKEGVGKSAFYGLFAAIFGEHNCATVDAENLLEGWTDFIAEKLFVVSHEVEMTEKQGLKKLKTLITEKRVRINAKYERKYETQNCANFLLLSNETNALRLTAESRRFFVIFSRAEPKEKAYYNNLFDCIENGAGWIEDYLMSRDLSSFSPHGPAPKTEGLQIVAMSSQSDLQTWLDDRASSGESGAFGKLTTASDIVSDAMLNAPQSVSRYITQRTAASWLAAHNYKPVVYWADGKACRGWFRGSKEEYQAELEKLKKKVSELA